MNLRDKRNRMLHIHRHKNSTRKVLVLSAVSTIGLVNKIINTIPNNDLTIGITTVLTNSYIGT